MIAEDIIKKLEKDRTLQLSRVEAGWLMARLRRTAGAQRSNEKYYKINETEKNRRDRWSEKDIDYLKKAFEAGVTDREIADKLQRTVKGVERMRHKLDIRRPEYRAQKEE